MSLTSYRAAPPRAEHNGREQTLDRPNRDCVSDNVNGFFKNSDAHRLQCLATTYSSIA